MSTTLCEKKANVICVDFDGVLHDDSNQEFKGNHIIEGYPVRGAYEWVQEMQKRKVNLAIYSCRSSTIAGREAMRSWCKLHFGDLMFFFFPEHKPFADFYLDDKAVQFIGVFPYCIGVDNVQD